MRSDLYESWEDCIPLIQAAYNSSRHQVTGQTPNTLVYGLDNPTILDYQFSDETSNTITTDPTYILQLRNMITEIHELARIHLKREQARMDAHKKTRPHRYEVGDWVWYWSVPDKQKFGSCWTGPWLVV